eukprot:1161386-Pelagomonas_calceolata.AAC.1
MYHQQPISQILGLCSRNQTQDETHILFNCSEEQFLHQRNAKLFCMPKLMDLFLAGCDQPQANQLNNLAEGHPYCNHLASALTVGSFLNGRLLIQYRPYNFHALLNSISIFLDLIGKQKFMKTDREEGIQKME